MRVGHFASSVNNKTIKYTPYCLTQSGETLWASHCTGQQENRDRMGWCTRSVDKKHF